MPIVTSRTSRMASKSLTRTPSSAGARPATHPLSPRLLARTLEEAHHGPAWHGPALRPILNGCDAAEASWRIADGRNTIWELVLHAAYGKHIIRIRLTGMHARFPRPAARYWWPAAPEPSDEAWSADLALLDATHRALVEAIETISPATLAKRRAGKRHTLGDEALGLALHDTYHGGQIALLRKLWPGR